MRAIGVLMLWLFEVAAIACGVLQRDAVVVACGAMTNWWNNIDSLRASVTNAAKCRNKSCVFRNLKKQS